MKLKPISGLQSSICYWSLVPHSIHYYSFAFSSPSSFVFFISFSIERLFTLYFLKKIGEKICSKENDLIQYHFEINFVVFFFFFFLHIIFTVDFWFNFNVPISQGIFFGEVFFILLAIPFWLYNKKAKSKGLFQLSFYSSSSTFILF